MNLVNLLFGGTKYFLPRIIQREGGHQESTTLRRIYREKHRVDVGLYSYGCFDPEFNYALGGTITVGRYCSFAKGVRYFAANHPVNYVAMSPYFYSKSFGYDVNDIERKSLTVGNGVWCGYGVLITSGCKSIGNGAVVAAGAVVTHDVAPYAIVAGNPAKIIRYRFEDETIKSIEESRWWEFTPDELMKFYENIDDPKKFCELVKGLRGDR